MAAFNPPGFFPYATLTTRRVPSSRQDFLPSFLRASSTGEGEKEEGINKYVLAFIGITFFPM
jgi:hypothetical protein